MKEIHQFILIIINQLKCHYNNLLKMKEIHQFILIIINQSKRNNMTLFKIIMLWNIKITMMNIMIIKKMTRKWKINIQKDNKKFWNLLKNNMINKLFEEINLILKIYILDKIKKLKKMNIHWNYSNN